MSLNKKMDQLIKNRPVYKTADEAFDNQALAKARAFGRDRSIQAAETKIDQDAANAAGQAQEITDSTSGLLATIAAINANKGTTVRGLAADEAAIQANNVQQLYGANQAMIDEKDKAWDFNVNQPYQNKVQALRDRKKARSEMVGNIAGAVVNAGAGFLTGGLLGDAQSEPTWGRGNPNYYN